MGVRTDQAMCALNEVGTPPTGRLGYAFAAYCSGVLVFGLHLSCA